MLSGCYTALVTPFIGDVIDEDGLEQLIDFQLSNGVAGIVAAGTTGESPTLSWAEHNQVIERIAHGTRGKGLCIAGTGSNNTAETLEATAHAVKAGAEAMLLVDPYYNGPSSLEIRKEYIEPVARQFPDTTIIPYVVPGRSGTQILPEDLSLARDRFSNVCAVKEATGNIDNMRWTRQCCGAEFMILSGDDNMTYQMMTDPLINACGVISVYANIFPGAMSQMVEAAAKEEYGVAERLERQLAPLLELVTVTTTEHTPFGPIMCRARNPLPVKTLMAMLGMPSGFCRQPLGRMTAGGLEKLLTSARSVFAASPELFAPLADFFDIDVEVHLNDYVAINSLVYDAY